MTERSLPARGKGRAGRDAGREREVVALDRFRKVERLASYEIAQALLDMNLRLQSRLGLRPEEFQVFLTIAVATVQRFARSADQHPDHLTRAPLPRELSGHISRRRIAESLGLPLETVRRHVARLIAKGEVIESGRGRLSTTGGILQRLAADETPHALACRFLSVTQTFDRLGILQSPGAAPARVQRAQAVPQGGAASHATGTRTAQREPDAEGDARP